MLRIGGEELLIRERYEVLGILDDILVVARFVVGSVLFFWEATTAAGTWLFLLGSIELAVRPSSGWLASTCAATSPPRPRLLRLDARLLKRHPPEWWTRLVLRTGVSWYT